MAYFVSDDLFFVFDRQHLVVWDYRAHRQFVVNKDYVDALLCIAACESIEHIDPAIIADLLHGQLIFNAESKQGVNQWNWDLLSKIYHIGTEDVAIYADGEVDFAKHYLAHCSGTLNSSDYRAFNDKRGVALIELPSPQIDLLADQSFLSVLQKRKTSRQFNGEPCDLQRLSTLLFAAFGLFHGEQWHDIKAQGLQQVGNHKTSPASGGLHSEEIYLTVYQVEGLVPGIYYYRPQDHRLALIREGDFEAEVIAINYQQTFSQGLSFGIYLCSQLDRIWWKYKHSRAYRVTLLDLGHLSQTTLLVATALGLHTWMTAAFVDSKVHELLNFTQSCEKAFFYLGFGYGANCALPKDIISACQ